MTDARTRLLAQILAVLGVSSVACRKGVVAADKPTDDLEDPAICPLEEGLQYSLPLEGPNAKNVNVVCLPGPANHCELFPNKCVLARYQCGRIDVGDKVLDKFPTNAPDTCCWKVQGDCAGRDSVAADKPTDDPKACPPRKSESRSLPRDPSKPHKKHRGIAMDVCLPKPANGDCASYPNQCVLSRYHCGQSEKGERVFDKVATNEPDTCCWTVFGSCPVGRPFIVGGHPRLAHLARGDEWNMHAIGFVPPSLDIETRALLADVWARDGLREHASVASFAQLVLELLALGAPSDLVLGAQEAMADEIRHAQRAFTLASLYAGDDVAPGPLDTRGAAAGSPDLANFAARAASEGCIAETIAALQLHAAAEGAESATLAALLRVTAEEESAHALLAYRIVAWAIAKGGDGVRVAVKRVFDGAPSHVGFGPFPDDKQDLRAHGILSRRDRDDLAVAALRDVVAPAGAALCVLARDGGQEEGPHTPHSPPSGPRRR